MATEPEQTQSPTGQNPSEVIEYAKELLIENLKARDVRTQVLAAAGIMNYYLASEIGQLLQVILSPVAVTSQPPYTEPMDDPE